MADPDEVSVRLTVHPDFRLLILPLQIGASTLHMFISGSPVIGISPDHWQRLLAEEHLVFPRERQRLYQLDHASVANMPVGRLSVRQSRRARAFGLDAEIGLNFFAAFSEACFQMPSQPDQLITLVLRRQS